MAASLYSDFMRVPEKHRIVYKVDGDALLVAQLRCQSLSFCLLLRKDRRSVLRRRFKPDGPQGALDVLNQKLAVQRMQYALFLYSARRKKAGPDHDLAGGQSLAVWIKVSIHTVSSLIS